MSHVLTGIWKHIFCISGVYIRIYQHIYGQQMTDQSKKTSTKDFQESRAGWQTNSRIANKHQLLQYTSIYTHMLIEYPDASKWNMSCTIHGLYIGLRGLEDTPEKKWKTNVSSETIIFHFCKEMKNKCFFWNNYFSFLQRNEKHMFLLKQLFFISAITKKLVMIALQKQI